MIFYNLRGESMGICDFLALYEPQYFNDSKSKQPPQKTSRFVEGKIDAILKNGMQPDDFKLVIAWKIGALCHRQSETQQKVVYAGNYDKTLVWPRTNTQAAPYINFLQSNFSRLLSLADDPYELYRELHGFAGFKHVYIITLMHFLTQGKMPIYDAYASVAVNAYLESIKPGNVVRRTSLPESMEDSWKKYNEYILRLEDIFGSGYSSRKVDRSLWVYGHYFTLNKAVKTC